MAGFSYYAVAVGRKPGIYTHYSDCAKQVKGFQGAKFKGFHDEKEAQAYINAVTNGSYTPAASKPAESANKRKVDETSPDTSTGTETTYKKTRAETSPVYSSSTFSTTSTTTQLTSPSVTTCTGDFSSPPRDGNTQYITLTLPNSHPIFIPLPSDATATGTGGTRTSVIVIQHNTNAVQVSHPLLQPTLKPDQMTPTISTNTNTNTNTSISRSGSMTIKPVGVAYDTRRVQTEVSSTGIIIFVDGCALGNPGLAGSGIFIRNQDTGAECRFLMHHGMETNNYAELQALAAIPDAIEEIVRDMPQFMNSLTDCIHVYTDSEWCLKSLSGEYKNTERYIPLMDATRKKLATFADKHNLLLQLEWVKAHVGIPGNEVADQLAKDAANAQHKGVGKLFEYARIKPEPRRR